MLEHVVRDLLFGRKLETRGEAVGSQQLAGNAFGSRCNGLEIVVGHDEGDLKKFGTLELECRVLGVEPAVQIARLGQGDRPASGVVSDAEARSGKPPPGGACGVFIVMTTTEASIPAMPTQSIGLAWSRPPEARIV